MMAFKCTGFRRRIGNLWNFIQHCHISKRELEMIKGRRNSYANETCGTSSIFSFSELPKVGLMCFRVSSHCYKVNTVSNVRSVQQSLSLCLLSSLLFSKTTEPIDSCWFAAKDCTITGYCILIVFVIPAFVGF